MANQDQLALLKQGVEVWNQWRKEHPDIRPDLSGATGAYLMKAHLKHANFQGANLRGANLGGADLDQANLSAADLSHANLWGVILRLANLSHANLSHAHLDEATLWGANLCDANLHETNLRRTDLSVASLERATLWGADLREADLHWANLEGANFRDANLSQANFHQAKLGLTDFYSADLNQANLREADLWRANFSFANLHQADLTGADLRHALLIETNLTGATLTQCSIYGISAWNVELEGAKQDSLCIARHDEPIITVDNLKIAQFIYLLLNNAEIRDVIDTIAKKAVLILGRFTPERKAVLDAMRDELRTHGYLPILFDFDKPAIRDITETVSTLAHLARFVIADITDAKSIPQELMIIVPNLPSVPVQPLILESQHEYGMFEHFKRFPWVLPVYRYTDEVNLLQSLQEKVITPAEQKVKELEKR